MQIPVIFTVLYFFVFAKKSSQTPNAVIKTNHHK